MMFYSEERKAAAKAVVELEVKNRKHVLTLYDGVIEVVKKFDGKVINKRFETALRNIDNSLRLERSGSRIDISYYCKNRYAGGRYLLWDYITLNNYMNTSVTDKNYCVVDYDGNGNCRLNAEKVIIHLLVRKNDIADEIKLIEEHHAKIEEYEKELEELKNKIESVSGKIPFLLKEYYGLRYDVKRNN